MGNTAGKFTHDPGNDGTHDGEGESVIVGYSLVYAATAYLVWYERRKAVNEAAAAAAQAPELTDAEKAAEKTAEEVAEEQDKVAQEKWTDPVVWQLSEENRHTFCKVFSFGMSDGSGESAGAKMLWTASGFNFMKMFVVLCVLYILYLFLISLSMLGTGFKLLGGKSSAKMFDVVDNPISGLMVGVLATVLVQSSSTSTSIIISLVGADELSVFNAIPMIMGANIGTSVTNTIVAMGHFSNKDDLRRGFAAATVHDLFNLLTVSLLLPLNWATKFLQEITSALTKGSDGCDDDSSSCESQEFIKPYLSPYVKAVAKYNKDVAKDVSQKYCGGKCGAKFSEEELARVYEGVCQDAEKKSCPGVPGFSGAWVDGAGFKSKRMPPYVRLSEAGEGPAMEYLLACPEGADCAAAPSLFGANGTAAAGAVFEVCAHANSEGDSYWETGLCDKRLLKGGLMYKEWGMTDEGAGILAVLLSLSALCCSLFLLVYSLQILLKGPLSTLLKKALSLNGYFSMLLGMVITILVQSSSITTSTLTPLCAVGLISLEQMFPLTLGANIGTTVTGLLAASVATSNPQAALQVALAHLFFNIIGILIWYPLPFMRNVPLRGARWLGVKTQQYGVFFPLIYTFVVFFTIPGICYGIAVAATQ